VGRDYILAQGRPVAVEVDTGVRTDELRAELRRLYGGDWRIGRFVRRDHRRRAPLEETRPGRDWSGDWLGQGGP
jgi:hypothetical protein